MAIHPQSNTRPQRDERFGAKCRVETSCQFGKWVFSFTRNGEDVFRIDLDGFRGSQIEFEEKVIALAGENIDDFINAEEVSHNDWGVVTMIKDAVAIRAKYK